MRLSPWPRRGDVLARALVIALSLCAASCSRRDDRPYVPKPGTAYDADTGLPVEIISSKDNAEMVLVKAGRFKKGDPNGLAPTTRVQAFYIDKYEVTNERYHRFTSATLHRTPAFVSDEGALFRWRDKHYEQGREKYPVVLVSFDDATAFATWAGKRLPSQTQWEYAARGTDGREFPWGNSRLPVGDCNTADRLAGETLVSREAWQTWYDQWIQQPPSTRNLRALQPVGLFPKDVSPAGCFDLGGNVREWCVLKGRNGSVNGVNSESIMGEELPSNGHVACGGSWLQDASATRAWRYGTGSSAQRFDVGFRCVVSAADPAIQALIQPADPSD